MPRSSSYLEKTSRKSRKKRSLQTADIEPEYETACGASEYTDPSSDAFGEAPLSDPADTDTRIPICRVRKVEALARELEQPSGWAYENGRIVPTYDYRFDGSDLVPLILSRLPGMRKAGITVQIRIKPVPTQHGVIPSGYTQKFPEQNDSGKEYSPAQILKIERVNDNHYYPVVDGKKMDQGGDGKCFFYSIWYALDQSTDENLKSVVYEGHIPRDKEAGAAYLRRKVIAYLRENPDEFSDFIAGDAESDLLDLDIVVNNHPAASTAISSEESIDLPAQFPRDMANRVPDLYADGFMPDDRGSISILPPIGDYALGLVEKVPFALGKIAKAVSQFAGESISRSAVPSGIMSFAPQLERYIPLAVASPLVTSIYRANDFKSQVRMAMLIVAAIMSVASPALTSYAVLIRLVSSLHALTEDKTWTGRGLDLLRAASHALQLPMSSEYAGTLLALLDNHFGAFAHVRRIFELEQRLMTDDPAIATALLSTALGYQLLLADDVTRSETGEREPLADAVDYLTAISRLRVEMESATLSGETCFVHGFNDVICRNLFAESRDGELMFAGMRIPLTSDQVTDICAHAKTCTDDSSTADGIGLLAYAMSRCDDLYSQRGIDTQLWSPQSWIPEDTLSLMTTCEAIRIYAGELRDRGRPVAEAFNFAAFDEAAGIITSRSATTSAAPVLQPLLGVTGTSVAGMVLALTGTTLTVWSVFLAAAGISLATMVWAIIKTQEEWAAKIAELRDSDRAPALPTGQAQVQIDPLSGNYSTWVYPSWFDLSFLSIFIANVFDNGLFNDTMALLRQSKNTSNLQGQPAIYVRAAKEAISDYKIDNATLGTRYTSSEDRYGAELYSFAKSANDGSPPDYGAMIYTLVKIKAYETCHLQDLVLAPASGKNSSAVSLETLLGIRIESYEFKPSMEELEKYLSAQFGDQDFDKIDENCWKGCAIASTLYADTLDDRYLKNQHRLNSLNILEISLSVSNAINSEISERQSFLYNHRGITYRTLCEEKRAELLQYRYAAMYLLRLTANSQQYLSILEALKNRYPRTSDATLAIRVLDSRAEAVREALRHFAPDNDRPALDELSSAELLDNYAALVASSDEVFQFITLTEAIFFNCKRGYPAGEHYRAAANPAQVVHVFREQFESLPFSQSAHRKGLEGLTYLQNIENSTEINDDTKYYAQFSLFKNTYLSDVAKLIALENMVHLGIHPYDIVSLRPVRCLHLTLSLDTLTPEKLSYISAGFQEATNQYVNAGDLIFCQLDFRSWLLISTIGGKLILKKLPQAEMIQNEAFRLIAHEDTRADISVIRPDRPHYSSNSAWMGKELDKLLLTPLFGSDFPLDRKQYLAAYLQYFPSKRSELNLQPTRLSRMGSRYTLFETIVLASKAMALKAAEFSKEDKYVRKWWQYITAAIPAFDMSYRAYHDPDYAPSLSEIAWEAINVALALVSLGIPLGELANVQANLLRESILINVHKGFRGLALVSRVVEHVGSDLAITSLRATASTASNLISFWEPIPLQFMGALMFNRLGGLIKGKMLFKKRPTGQRIGAIGSVSWESPKADPAAAKSSPGDRPSQIFRHGSNDPAVVYEFSYTQEAEVLLGADNHPPSTSRDPQPSGVAKGFAWDGTSSALENKGAIVLDPRRPRSTPGTLFTFAGNDREVRSRNRISSTDPAPNTGVDSLQFGRAEDIAFSRFSEEIAFVAGAPSANQGIEVLLVPSGDEGALGIRIDLESIGEGRSMLISSGPLSDSLFMMGISEREGSVYFYHVSKPPIEAAVFGPQGPTVGRLLSVHNTLATDPMMRVAIPGDASLNDIHFLARKFDYATIAHSDPDGESGFHLVDQKRRISGTSALHTASNHVVSSRNLAILNYGLLGTDTNVIKTEGQAYYLISHGPNEKFKIEGRVEVAGLHDPDAAALPEIIEASQKARGRVIADIMDIMTRNAAWNKFARFPAELQPQDLYQLARYFSTNRYDITFRLMKIWSPAKPPRAQLHSLILIQKDGFKYAIDITATRFSDEGIISPIFDSDSTWASVYQRHLNDRFCLYEDFQSFESFKTRMAQGVGTDSPYEDARKASWIVLNRPVWMLSRSNHVLVDALNIDREVDLLPPELYPPIGQSAPDLHGAFAPTFFESFNHIIEDEEFLKAIMGTNIIKSMETIERLANKQGLRPKILVFLKYIKISDIDPAVDYVMVFYNDNRIAHVIEPLSRSATRHTQIYSWPEWIASHSNGITVARTFRNVSRARRFVRSSVAGQPFGLADFFDESQQRYEILAFDKSYASDLDFVIQNVHSEIKKYPVDFHRTYLPVEQKKLEALRINMHAAGADADLPLRTALFEQEKLIEDLTKYRLLVGQLSRLTDLQGRITSSVLQKGVPQQVFYDTRNMVGNRLALSVRFIATYPFIQEKLQIRKYDHDKDKYISSDRFELIPLGSIEHMIKIEDVRAILKNFRDLYDEMRALATDYASEGGGTRALDLAANAASGSTVASYILGHYLSTDARVFAVIEKPPKKGQRPTILGISTMLDISTEMEDTWEMGSIIAHPFSQVRNYPEFIEYVLRHRRSDAWNFQELSKYKVEGIGSFLSYQTMKYAVFHIPGLNKVVAVAVNPRSENIAAAFGMVRVDDLAYHRGVWGPEFFNRFRTYLNNVLRGRSTRPAISEPEFAPRPEKTALEKISQGDLASVAGKGAIYLKTDREIRTLPFSFVFARNDAELTHTAAQSSALLEYLSPFGIQVGQGTDIASYSPTSSISYGQFWSGEQDELGKLDVIQIPHGNNGANGLKILFNDLIASRPVLISSGALSGSTFIIGIIKNDNAIYFFHAGKAGTGGSWNTQTNGILSIEQVFLTLTDKKYTTNFSENPTSAELRKLYDFFDHIYVFTSRRPGATEGRIDRTDANHWAFHYGNAGDELSIGNSQLMILKNSDGLVQIDGFVELASIGETPVQTVRVTSADSIGRYLPSSSAPPSPVVSSAISDLRAKIEGNKKLTDLARNVRSKESAVAGTLLSFLQEEDRLVRCRLVLVWPLPNTLEPQSHYLVVDNSEEIPIALDITAGRIPAFGSPFFGTEEMWAKQFRDAYPRSFIAYRDFDDFTQIDPALTGAISPGDHAVRAMNTLNVPEWRSRAVDCPMYPYTVKETTLFSVSIDPALYGQLDFNERELNPEWAVKVDLKDATVDGNGEEIFKGVYRTRQKRYYIQVDEHTYEVVLNRQTGWTIKLDPGAGTPSAPIAIRRNAGGRWVVKGDWPAIVAPVRPAGGHTSAPSLRRLADRLSDLSVNRVLWNDNYAIRAVARSYAAMEVKIQKAIREAGGLDAYLESHSDPYAPIEPSGTLLANNLLKLFLEDDVPVNPQNIEMLDFAVFSTTLAGLDPQKNYIFLISDARLSHTYLLDFPAGADTKAFVLQTNSGEGVMPRVTFKEWINRRDQRNVKTADLLDLMSPVFAYFPVLEKRRILASVLDVDRNPDYIDLSQLRANEQVTFLVQQYDQATFERNIDELLHTGSKQN